MDYFHIPVMPKEAIDYLVVKKDEWYVDCNLGGGGHTEEILKLGGKVLGLDLDPEAIREVALRHQLRVKKVETGLEVVSEKLILFQSNFSEIKQVINYFKLNKICGVLFDLGISTHQLESASRGFSFNSPAPLDMRMNPENQITAADLVNGLYEKELAELFWKLGEEGFARPIAKKIVEYRKNKKIETTDELARIILGVILKVRKRSVEDRTHPATRIFQALRIAVNDELNNLKMALPEAVDVLTPKGRLVVISFHSLEDRIVKDFFIDQQKEGNIKILTKKPIIPSDSEVSENPRSRSGKLRAAERI